MVEMVDAPFEFIGRQEISAEEEKINEERLKQLEYDLIPSKEWWDENAAHLHLDFFQDVIDRLKEKGLYRPLFFKDNEILQIRPAIAGEMITAMIGMKMWADYVLAEGDFVYTKNCGTYRYGPLTPAQKEDMIAGYVEVEEGVYRPKDYQDTKIFIIAPHTLKYKTQTSDGLFVMHVIKKGDFVLLDGKRKTFTLREMQERFSPMGTSVSVIFEQAITQENER